VASCEDERSIYSGVVAEPNVRIKSVSDHDAFLLILWFYAKVHSEQLKNVGIWLSTDIRFDPCGVRKNSIYDTDRW